MLLSKPSLIETVTDCSDYEDEDNETADDGDVVDRTNVKARFPIMTQIFPLSNVR